MSLLSISSDAKTVKGEAFGYLTGILYLAPADLSGRNVCPMASKGCKAACLNTAGRGGTSSVQAARLRRTNRYFEDRQGFLAELEGDIEALCRKAKREGLVPVVRLNGTSDIPWERIRFADGSTLMERHPDVQFYDYTKVVKRAVAFGRGEMPPNYHLTFSLSEDNDNAAVEALKNGCNVAAVFRTIPEAVAVEGGASIGGHQLKPCYWFTGARIPMYRTVDGDASDLRFKDPKGVIVALKAKGKARKDDSGFVR